VGRRGKRGKRLTSAIRKEVSPIKRVPSSRSMAPALSDIDDDPVDPADPSPAAAEADEEAAELGAAGSTVIRLSGSRLPRSKSEKDRLLALAHDVIASGAPTEQRSLAAIGRKHSSERLAPVGKPIKRSVGSELALCLGAEMHL